MSDKIGYEDLFEGDAFKGAESGISALVNGFKELSKEIKSGLSVQKEFFSGFKVQNSEDIKKLNEELDKTNKKLVELEKTEKAVAVGELELAKIRQQNAKAIQEEEKAAQQKLRTDKVASTQRKAELTEYQKQSKSLNDLRNAYKELAVAGRENGKVAKGLLQDITALDTKLKAIDRTVGQNQRNVGNYSSALSGFSKSVNNILGAAGIGVGLSAGFDFLKDSVAEFSKFESSLKNLQAITGVTAKDLKFFEENAKELGIGVKGGASAVVEAYKLIGSAKPELLENKDALNAVTKSAILLSQAAGLELPDAATRLTDALNQYGASADQAGKFTDVLAAGAKAGAAEVPDITDALLKFGVAAKSSNISVQESVGAIELLAEKGIKGAEAGTQLRNVFAKLSAADVLPREALNQLKEAGVNINILKDSALPLNVRLKELSKISGDASAITKVFGLENKAAGEILISNLPRLQDLTNAVNENGVALKQAGVNTDTYAFKQQRLGNIWDEFKSSIGEFLVGEATVFLDMWDIATGKITATSVAVRMAKKDIEEFAEAVVKKDKSGRESSLKEITDKIDENNAILAKLEEGNFIQNPINFTKFNQLKSQQEFLRAKRDAIVEASKKLTEASYKESEAAKKLFGDKNKETGALNDNTNATEKNTEAKKASNDEARLRIQIENQQDQSILTNQVRDEALAKREYERKKKEIEESKASQKTKNEALLQLDLEYYNKRADIENKYIDEKEKKEKDEKAKKKKENDEAFNEAWEEALRLQKIEDEARDEKSKKDKEAKEKQRKEAFDAANQLLEIAEKRINQEQEMANDAIDSEISKRESALDEQKRRAEQGLSSDIATAEKNLKDAEARKKEIENQAIKRQQALTFFKLLSANAESDPNNALTKTFTEMLLSEALVKSLPGFFKGTENVERDLKGNKVHNGRDGHVIAVDGGERVMTGDQNKLMGGMANDDVANLVYRHNNNLLPNYMINEPLSPIGVAENMYNSIQLQQLVKQNEELIKAVKSIPGTSIMFSDGKMKRTDNVNGFKTTTIKPLTRGYDN